MECDLVAGDFPGLEVNFRYALERCLLRELPKLHVTADEQVLHTIEQICSICNVFLPLLHRRCRVLVPGRSVLPDCLAVSDQNNVISRASKAHSHSSRAAHVER